MNEKTNEYTVAKPFVHDNVPRAAGDVIELTRAQAQFLMLGGFLERLPARPAAKAKAGKGGEQ